jgi:two-component system response regulator YesN
MDDGLCLGTIASTVHMSQGYLSQIFKQETDMSINNYLISVRLEKARELLRTTDKRIYEIARDVGYKDEFYLSNAFKKNVGMRPSEYRDILIDSK